MGNWTPEGFAGNMFKTVAKHVAPPPGIPSPVLWGNEDTVMSRFAEGVTDLKLTRRPILFRFPFPPAEVVGHLPGVVGDQVAFASLDADGQAALRADLEQLWVENNRSTDGGTELGSEYLEVLATRI